MALFQNIVAMLIFSTIGLFVKQIPFSSPMIALLRTFLGALMLGLVLLGLRKKPHIQKKEGKWVLLSALFLGCNWVFLFEGYRYTSVANATVIYYMAPVIIVIYALCVEHLHITRRMIGSFILTLVGFWAISAQASQVSGRGILYSLFAAIAYAGVVIVNRRIHMEALPFTFVQLAIATAILLPYTYITEGFTQGMSISFSVLPWILTIGIVHTGIAYVLYFSSITTLSPSKVAIFSYLDPGVAILLSYFVLHDDMTPLQWMGIVAIAIGLIQTQRGRESDVL